ncbi:MAG: hypothetical protein IH599_05585 [Bacteroidales bacterium]|nr:hypothetical protein [Bacteroidales bacterium]
MPVIKTRMVTTTDGSAGTHSYRSEYTEFNPSGLPILEETWDAAGQLTERYIRTYDEQGRLIREVLHQDEEDMAEERWLVWDEAGRLAQESRHYQDGSISTTTYTYDGQGRRLRAVGVDEEGEEEFVEETGYASGDVKLWEKRLEYGEPVWSREWNQDDEGRVTRYRLEDHGEDTLMEHVYEFDEEGRLIEEKMYRNSRLVMIRRQVFDDEGRVSMINNQNERGEEKVTFTYDESGHQVGQVALDANDSFLHEVKRTYDADGNILTSGVRMTDPATGAEQSYRLDYHYEYYQD